MADYYKSDYCSIAFKKEGSYNETPTQGAQTVWFGVVPKADLDHYFEFHDWRTINQDRDLFVEAQGKFVTEGSIPIEMQNGRMIYYAMGSESYASPTHTITGGRTIPSMCIEVEYKGTNKFMRYFGGTKVDSLTLNVNEEGAVDAQVSWKGAKVTKGSGTSSTISAVSTKPFMYHQTSMTIGGYAFNITNWKWSVKNTLKPIYTCKTTDGQYITNLVEGKREYEITATTMIEDTATYNTYVYDNMITGANITVIGSIIRTASTDQMILTASNCTIRKAPHNLPDVGEPISVEITLVPRTCTWVIADALPAYAS